VLVAVFLCWGNRGQIKRRLRRSESKL
jgi:hypothetical protein